MKINEEMKTVFYDRAYEECETEEEFAGIDNFYDILVEWDLATQEELELAGFLRGYTADTVEEVFYLRSGGYRDPDDYLYDNLDPEEREKLLENPEEEPEEDSKETESKE